MNIFKLLVICLIVLALSIVEAKKPKRRMRGRAGKEPKVRKAEVGDICYYGGASSEFAVPDKWWPCVAGTTCIKVSCKLLLIDRVSEHKFNICDAYE